MTTTRAMKTDPRIIYHLIQSQAGTLAKAIQELVQNSIDAGATSCAIVLAGDGRTFTVQDDGRGFGSEREIEDLFGTFGTPHEEGDSTFGRFRIGRGQSWAFASTIWRTNTFQMDVSNRRLNAAACGSSTRPY